MITAQQMFDHAIAVYAALSADPTVSYAMLRAAWRMVEERRAALYAEQARQYNAAGY